MVEIIYEGRLGNRLFQYCFGRILAENLGLKLKASHIEGFPNTQKEVGGFDYSDYPSCVLSGHKVNLRSILQDKTKRKIILKDGFFQRYEYYKEFKDTIRLNWLNTFSPQIRQANTQDIVLHIRRTDYVNRGHDQPFSYFDEALSLARFERVFICTDGPHDPFMKLFKKYNPVIFHNEFSALDDFWFIMSFKKIVLSASSFSWWAGFLSNATEIYFPVPKIGPWCSPDVDLRIDDEDRYIFIKCKEDIFRVAKYRLIRSSLGYRLVAGIRIVSSVLQNAHAVVLRILKDMFRIKDQMHWVQISLFHKSSSFFRLNSPLELRPLWISWNGYTGPWIENYFFDFWCKNERAIVKSNKIKRIFIPIWWTDCYHRYGKSSSKKIKAFIDEHVKADEKYFTIVQNDDGILDGVPGNVLIFAGGGVGDIPIPLLRGKLHPRRVERNILCSFMGELSGPHDRTGVRSEMFKRLRDKPGFYFGKGSMDDFIAVTSRSVFALCPRGYGRTSFRLYEAMDLGAIPIYIWDDLEWLPYKNRLDWDAFSISINVKDIVNIPEIIYAYSAEKIKQRQDKIRQLRDEYFTLEGTCKQIIRILENQEYAQNK
ncbi:MAG: exostosin family protein [Candidatus Omnitrophica bacterium]|nr:exostosin family protein [Candidatus Omnitrophota bacterium]